MKKKWMWMALLLALSGHAIADEVDAAARIEALEKQLKALSEELMAVQQQMAQTKDAKMDEKGKSKGNAVYAAFKDGLVLDDGTGNWSLQLNGRIQADYRAIDPTVWKNDTFSIRRARLGAQFTFLKDFLLRVEGEYSNTNDGSKGTVGMTYGYVEYKHFPGARIRIGQFKPVFGLERAQSTNFTDFQELSMATATGAIFNSTYDRGVMLFGSPFKGTYYNLSYVNGSGQNNDDTKDNKDVIGRAVINVADWAEWNKAVVHMGGTVSRGTSQPTTATGTLTLSGYTESNGITTNTLATSSTVATKFFSTAAFTGDDLDKDRWGLETALAYGPVKLQSEYIRANYSGRTTANRTFDKDINAWYADVNWLVTGESYADSYKDGMFGRITPKTSFSIDKGGYGAIELGLRYSLFDASDFVTSANGCVAGTGCLTTPTAAASFTNQADAWTAGAKWIMTPNARIVLNYIHTEFDTPIIINSKSSNTENAVTFRAQYDF
ncbi:MAG: porin [Methylophilales bacterium]|nr:porin [Methylophilales bacterium]